VQAAVDSLKGFSLVMETSGGRVARYAHNLERVLQVPAASAALLTVLMLRGPQTAGELRIACERLHKFSDISAVQGFLQELAARPAGALAVELPRLPGSRENRWAHLLSGAPVIDAARAESPAGGDVAPGEVAALKLRVTQLEREIAALKETLLRMQAELGLEAKAE
jgi:uncharacterized protein YceH (UPF0502 family)